MGFKPLKPSVKPPTPKPKSAGTSKSRLVDAQRYILTIKNKFRNHSPEKYHEFLNIFKDFSMERIGTDTVTARVKILFRGYPDLLDGFNKYMPRSMKIII
uniref:Histone deacetylase interacting domain-containing protein n=1 Tax=Leersia perrieri TaxID=77586 RepID=A0A0D9X6W8_9ORYZ